MTEGGTIVIGSSREQKLPSLVLEYSIQKHASEDVKIIHTWDMTFPAPKLAKNQSRTGFSFNRFAIPKLAGYEGLGVYLECDQLVFGDVKELLGIPFKGATVLRPANQAAVLLLDCARLTWDVEKIIESLDKGAFTYHDLMEKMCVEPAKNIQSRIPNEWNSLDQYVPGKTKNLHYTNMSEQPWRKWGHPLKGMWFKVLREAVAEGMIPVATVEEEVKLRYVIPQVREAV